MTIHEALPSSGRSRLLVAAALLAIASLAAWVLLSGKERADAINLSGSAGVWSSVSGGDCVTGLNTSQVRWGSGDDGCADESEKSGYSWDGNSVFGITFDEPFLLGTFTHTNFPIGKGSGADEATLHLVMEFTDPEATVELDVVFDHHETPNKAEPCAYTGPGIDN